jgi:hypothetical protein
MIMAISGYATRPALMASLFGAVLGGVRAAQIEPSEGLREV